MPTIESQIPPAFAEEPIPLRLPFGLGCVVELTTPEQVLASTQGNPKWTPIRYPDGSNGLELDSTPLQD